MSSHSHKAKIPISNYIIAYKFSLGVFETLLGIAIILFGKQAVMVYEAFKSRELLEDPHDLLIQILQSLIPYLLTHRGLIVLILFGLGFIKIFGAIGLWYGKHWGLDLLVGLTFLVLPFDLYYLIINPSLPKLSFFLINMFIAFYLIQFEPRKYFKEFVKRNGLSKK